MFKFINSRQKKKKLKLTMLKLKQKEYLLKHFKIMNFLLLLKMNILEDFFVTYLF